MQNLVQEKVNSSLKSLKSFPRVSRFLAASPHKEEMLQEIGTLFVSKSVPISCSISSQRGDAAGNWDTLRFEECPDFLQHLLTKRRCCRKLGHSSFRRVSRFLAASPHKEEMLQEIGTLFVSKSVPISCSISSQRGDAAGNWDTLRFQECPDFLQHLLTKRRCCKKSGHSSKR